MMQMLPKNTESNVSLIICIRPQLNQLVLNCKQQFTFTALYKLKRIEMYMSHHWALSEDTKIIHCLAHKHDKNLCSSQNLLLEYCKNYLIILGQQLSTCLVVFKRSLKAEGSKHITNSNFLSLQESINSERLKDTALHQSYKK